MYFLAVLGLCCCTQAFPSCSEREVVFTAVYGFLCGRAPGLQLEGDHNL